MRRSTMLPAGLGLLVLLGAQRAGGFTILADAMSVSGDSISRAFNSNTSSCNYGDNPARVWATGDNHGTDYCGAGPDGTFSHAERLECAKQGDITIFNDAESGADMVGDFAAQAAAIRLNLSGSPPPRYVPVFLGHNDACTNTTSKTGNSCSGDRDPNNYCRRTNAAFEHEFRRGMDELIQIPSVRIGVLATVRVSELCNFTGKSSCGLGFGLPCSTVWQVIDTVFGSGGICASLTSDCSNQRRIDMYDTLIGYNEILERVSAEYEAIPAGGLSATGAVKASDVRIRFSMGPFNYRFVSADLSCCDCFHPSDVGQAKLAEFVWNGLQCSPTNPCCATSGDPLTDARCDALDTTTSYPGGFWPSCASAAECDDGDPCTTDICDPQAGCVYEDADPGTPCDDGNACTQADTCQAGACVGTDPVVCTPADQCHAAGTCDPSTGVCSNPPRPNDTPCDDGDACTLIDTCQGGTCTGANEVVCVADECHEVGSCDPSTGVCSSPVKPDGAPCEDGNPCTEGDTCTAGVCEAGAPVVCAASDQCHLPGTCDPETGACSNPPKPDGSPCDDGSVCTSGATCSGGSCGGGVATLACGPCEACDPVAGCVPAVATDCRRPIVAGAARLVARDRPTDGADTLTWKWGKGKATTKPELGNPETTTGYTLCVYDQEAGGTRLLVEARAPAGGECAGRPCWRQGATGYRYGDKDLTPDGLLKLLLRAGADGQAKIAVKGKGANLRLPAPPYTPAVTVQLKSDTGLCWGASYGAPRANGGGKFSARGD